MNESFEIVREELQAGQLRNFRWKNLFSDENYVCFESGRIKLISLYNKKFY